MDETRAPHPLTEVILSEPTVGAGPTKEQRHRGNPLTCPNVRDPFTNLEHLGAEFVAENLRIGSTGERMWLDRCSDRSMGELVHIRAADATKDRRNKYLPGRWSRRIGNVLDSNVSATVINSGANFATPCWFVVKTTLSALVRCSTGPPAAIPDWRGTGKAAEQDLLHKADVAPAP
jgi:hypothetical protein